MRIVHVVTAGASRYDRSCAAIDLGIGPDIEHDLFELLPGGCTRNGIPATVEDLSAHLRSGAANLLHVHGTAKPPAGLLKGLPIPWISDRPVPLPRSLFRRISPPRFVLADLAIPEAAHDDWFVERPARGSGGSRRRVGSYVRSAGARNNSEQASGRIQRFRDDVEWIHFDQPPSPLELAGLDLWVDPASSEDDVEGMVVEAIACLTPVVAARTEINSRRLDDGKAGLLAPIGDHNEMTHAVLGMLFKNEVAMPLRLHAEQIRDRFRPQSRRAAVSRLYTEAVS